MDGDNNISLVDAINNGYEAPANCQVKEVMVIKQDTTEKVQYRVPRPEGANFDAQDFERSGDCLYQLTVTNGSSAARTLFFGAGYVSSMQIPGYGAAIGFPADSFDDPAVLDNDSAFVTGHGTPALKKFNNFFNGRSGAARHIDATINNGTPTQIAQQFQQSLNPLHVNLDQDSCSRKGKKLFCFLCPWQNNADGLNNIRRFTATGTVNCGADWLTFGPFTGYTYTINPGMSVTFEMGIAALNTIDTIRDCATGAVSAVSVMKQ